MFDEKKTSRQRYYSVHKALTALLEEEAEDFFGEERVDSCDDDWSTPGLNESLDLRVDDARSSNSEGDENDTQWWMYSAVFFSFSKNLSKPC